MIQFVQPIFLWALAALAVPVGIHLLSRKEGKMIKVGSLRHLRETSTQQFKGIKLNEILLLALRCLLIVLIVSWLAGFQWNSYEEKKWVLVEPGLENNPQVKKAVDSLEADGFEWRWLQRGFPLQEHRGESAINYWRVINDLNKERVLRAIVFSNSRVKNFNGVRPEMDSAITWISVSQEPTTFVLNALKKSENQFLIRKGNATPERTSFNTEQVSVCPDSLIAKPIKQIKISLVYDKSYGMDVQILKAALNAIEQTLPVEFVIQNSNDLRAESEWVFWFSDELIPSKDSANFIVLMPKTKNELISREKVKEWAITKRLTVDIARHENFSLQLADLMLADSELEDRVDRYDQRALPEPITFSGGEKSQSLLKADLMPGTPNKFVFLVFLLVLLVERVVAYVRKQ